MKKSLNILLAVALLAQAVPVLAMKPAPTDAERAAQTASFADAREAMVTSETEGRAELEKEQSDAVNVIRREFAPTFSEKMKNAASSASGKMKNAASSVKTFVSNNKVAVGVTSVLSLALIASIVDSATNKDSRIRKGISWIVSKFKTPEVVVNGPQTIVEAAKSAVNYGYKVEAAVEAPTTK